mgnify:CR=1 FL=1
MVLTLWLTAAAVAAPPPNDNFADRIIIQQPPPGGSIIVTGTLNGATLEPGEPVGYGFSEPGGTGPTKSVWFELVANHVGTSPVFELIDRTDGDRKNWLTFYFGTNNPAPGFPISNGGGGVPFHPVLARPQM